MPEDLSLELTFAYLLSINVQVFRGKCVFVCVCVCVYGPGGIGVGPSRAGGQARVWGPKPHF